MVTETARTNEKLTSNDKMSIHANVVNLARRWSVQNEPDLATENFVEDDGNSLFQPQKYTKDECESIASHLLHFNQLPAPCMKYEDVASGLKRRDSDTTHGTSILS